MGKLNTPAIRQNIFKRNLIILQLQSVVVGILSGITAFVFQYIHHPSNQTIFKLMLLITSSIMTGCISCTILGSLISVLIIFALKWEVDPDNILTPIASSFGDLISIIIFSIISVVFVSFFNIYLLTISLILITIVFIFILTEVINTPINQITLTSWVPLLISLFITSGSGILFENYVYLYHGIAFMIPINQGLSSNIGSIYASRISTALQMKNKKYKETKWTIIATLFCINLFFQAGFLFIIYKLKILSMNITFIITYQIISGCVVIISLFLGEILTHLFWKYNLDPDTHSFPILSSVVDFIATLSLISCFRLSIS